MKFLFNTYTIAVILISIFNYSPEPCPITMVEEKQERASIIFILGQDKDDNRYYDRAEDYYRTHPDTKNHLLINSCRSLVDIRTYLEEHPTDNNQAWGKITLVVHSNEWRGLGIPIEKNGPRINVENLSSALDGTQLNPLKNSVIDSSTVLEINACGLGKNKKLVGLIGQSFGNCQVNSTPYFVMYDKQDDIAYKHEADYYYAFYQTAFRPSDKELSDQLRNRYPNSDINWAEALDRKNPRFSGDSFHYYFNIPINWVVTFPNRNERPTLNSKADKMEWLKEQKELMNIIEKTKIPIDKFRWRLANINHKFEDGTTAPSIMIKGKSSVLCVLKARVEHEKLCGL